MRQRPSYKKSWPGKTLGELLNFLNERHPEGIYIKEVAARLGTTCQNISWMFSKDDMKLSKAEEIANRYGYTLRLYFPLRTYMNGITVPPARRVFPNAGNLSGLVQYIYDSNYSINFVALQMNCSPSLLARAFNTGDVLLSTMYRITDQLGINVIWSFEPNEITDEQI